MGTSQFTDRLKSLVLLVFPFVLSIPSSNPASADSTLDGLDAIEGIYQGEIYLQSIDGKLNRPIASPIELVLQKNQADLILKASSDFVGTKCRSKIGEIRELHTFGKGHPQVLKASFSFRAGKCFEKEKFDTLLMFVNRDSNGSLVMETLLSRSGERDSSFKKRFYIHGYFSKKGSDEKPPET